MPGAFARTGVLTEAEVERVPDGGTVDLVGPGVLSFDGERDRTLADGQVAHATVRRDGPHVINPQRTIAAAARARRFDR